LQQAIHSIGDGAEADKGLGNVGANERNGGNVGDAVDIRQSAYLYVLQSDSFAYVFMGDSLYIRPLSIQFV
jgi:hypothetical protein